MVSSYLPNSVLNNRGQSISKTDDLKFGLTSCVSVIFTTLTFPKLVTEWMYHEIFLDAKMSLPAIIASPWRRDLAEMGKLKIWIKNKSLSGFCSMKQQGALLSPPPTPPPPLDVMLVYRRIIIFPWRAVSPDFPASSIGPVDSFVGTERGAERVKCLAQQHNIATSGTAWTLTPRSYLPRATRTD